MCHVLVNLEEMLSKVFRKIDFVLGRMGISRDGATAFLSIASPQRGQEPTRRGE